MKVRNQRALPARRRRAVIWMLAAFGVLIGGLAGGTVLLAWRVDIAWTVPLASFAGYLVTFRRGMLLWNPEVDGSWRHSLGSAVTPGRNGRPKVSGPSSGAMSVVR